MQTPVDNIRSFHLYCRKSHRTWFRILKFLIFIVACIGLVGDMTDFISGHLWSRLLILAGFLLPAVLTFTEFAESYEKRFTIEESVPGIYEGIQPPAKGWERLDLRVQGRPEPVFRSNEADLFLQSSTPIALERDKRYEKDLRRRIRDKECWENVFYPFLRHNYREAMYHGKQFYNEKKYGLSQPIDFAEKKAKVHKTCYYDTYLTNIIPGKILKYNRDMNMAADACAPEFLPYREDTDGERRLYETGEIRTANELGVTTLMIMPNNYIRLWTQNRLSQCSSGLFVASGSGSADWKDCKKFFGDPDGFRKAVICGMERELWEESNGSRANGFKSFSANVETRITGYFRWLKKGGKSEFVGVSRLKDRSAVGNLSPEYSEVFPGKDLHAETIKELIQSIDREITLKDAVLESDHCAVSCTMALYALRLLCVRYCADCRRRNNDLCPGEPCDKEPFHVLFE
ncbi:MAG: hypothetical protein ACI4PP_07275 [Clostridia bacterium]